MSKQKALNYLHEQIERELELIKYLQDNSGNSSSLSKSKILTKENQQYLKTTEDIHILSGVIGSISVITADKLLKTVDSARTFIQLY